MNLKQNELKCRRIVGAERSSVESNVKSTGPMWNPLAFESRKSECEGDRVGRRAISPDRR